MQTYHIYYINNLNTTKGEHKGVHLIKLLQWINGLNHVLRQNNSTIHLKLWFPHPCSSCSLL
jgi:hypothetical protein